MQLFGQSISLALEDQATAVRLGELLIAEGSIRSDDLQQALEIQNQERRDANLPMGALLTKYTSMRADQLDNLLQHPELHKTIADLAVTAGVLSPSQLATCLRLKRVNEGLGRAMQRRHPMVREQIEALMQAQPILGDLAKDLGLISKQELARVKGIQGGRRALVDVLSDLNLADSEDLAHMLEKYGPDILSEQVVNILLKEALRQGASSIHLDTHNPGVQLNLRIGAACKQEVLNQPSGKQRLTAAAVAGHIKKLAGLETDSGQMPQNGVFSLVRQVSENQGGRTIDCHVATCPSLAGERINIRMAQTSGFGSTLDDMNYSPGPLAALKQLLHKRHGMLLVSGPAGSGKRTTLYAALRHLRHPGANIFTAEDPIEYRLPGVVQAQAAPARGLTLAGLLRSFRRLDADVIFVDELRDRQTAAAAFEAVQNGCLLLSSLPAHDAVDTILRLKALEIDTDRIGTGVIGILAQRRLPKICPSCKQPQLPEQHVWELFFDRTPDPETFHAGAGCAICNHTGYQGTTMICELLEFSPQTALTIRRGAGAEQLKHLARSQGMRTMVQDGLEKPDQVRLVDLVRAVPLGMINAYGERRQIRSAAEAEATPPRLGELEERVSLTLHAPQVQAEEIDRLFARYQQLRGQAGQPPIEADNALFRRFISQSFAEVQSRQVCQAVRIEIIAAGTGVQISAIPVEEKS